MDQIVKTMFKVSAGLRSCCSVEPGLMLIITSCITFIYSQPIKTWSDSKVVFKKWLRSQRFRLVFINSFTSHVQQRVFVQTANENYQRVINEGRFADILKRFKKRSVRVVMNVLAPW